MKRLRLGISGSLSCGAREVRSPSVARGNPACRGTFGGRRKAVRVILGKIEGRKRRGQQRMRWLDGITYSMDMNRGK